ncbi:hypothetical protein Q3G72_010479 [Acer saccharum]|nr:hypothetical protein Q3G72_010479 [Acer saccharum]
MTFAVAWSPSGDMGAGITASGWNRCSILRERHCQDTRRIVLTCIHRPCIYKRVGNDIQNIAQNDNHFNDKGLEQRKWDCEFKEEVKK